MNGSSMAQRYSSQTVFTLISLSSRRLLTPARVQKARRYSSLTRMRRALRSREKLTRSASMRRTQRYCSSRMFACLQTRCLVKRTRASLFLWMSYPASALVLQPKPLPPQRAHWISRSNTLKNARRLDRKSVNSKTLALSWPMSKPKWRLIGHFTSSARLNMRLMSSLPMRPPC